MKQLVNVLLSLAVIPLGAWWFSVGEDALPVGESIFFSCMIVGLMWFPYLPKRWGVAGYAALAVVLEGVFTLFLMAARGRPCPDALLAAVPVAVVIAAMSWLIGRAMSRYQLK